MSVVKYMILNILLLTTLVCRRTEKGNLAQSMQPTVSSGYGADSHHLTSGLGTLYRKFLLDSALKKIKKWNLVTKSL